MDIENTRLNVVQTSFLRTLNTYFYILVVSYPLLFTFYPLWSATRTLEQSRPHRFVEMIDSDTATAR